MGLVHVDCPSCGGLLSLTEGERIVVCRYCGGPSLVLVPGAVPRHAIMATIDEEAAVRTVRKRLQQPGVARAARGARMDSVGLLYVPFYEASAVRLGRLVVRDRVKPPAPLSDSRQDDAALDRWLQDPGEEREDTKVIEQDVVRIGPACELRELGGERIRLAELRRGGAKILLQPFDPVAMQRRAVVLAPTLPAGRFLEQTTWRVRSASDSTAYVETRLKLLYYPVWQVRFRHLGRLYTLAVDGVTGALLAGSGPRDRGLVAAAAAAGVSLGTLGAGRWLRWMLVGGAPAAAFLVLAIAGGALAWLASRWLEQGGEFVLRDE